MNKIQIISNLYKSTTIEVHGFYVAHDKVIYQKIAGQLHISKKVSDFILYNYTHLCDGSSFMGFSNMCAITKKLYKHDNRVLIEWR